MVGLVSKWLLDWRKGFAVFVLILVLNSNHIKRIYTTYFLSALMWRLGMFLAMKNILKNQWNNKIGLYVYHDDHSTCLFSAVIFLLRTDCTTASLDTCLCLFYSAQTQLLVRFILVFTNVKLNNVFMLLRFVFNVFQSHLKMFVEV